MSFITDIQTIFENEYPDGTFIFYDQINADRSTLAVSTDNYPIMIVDSSIDRDVTIMDNQNQHEVTNFVVWLLGQDVQGNTATQSEAIVSPLRDKMKDILGRFYREAANVVNVPGENPSYRITDVHHGFTGDLSGVVARPSPNIAYTPRLCAKKGEE